MQKPLHLHCILGYLGNKTRISQRETLYLNSHSESSQVHYSAQIPPKIDNFWVFDSFLMKGKLIDSLMEQFIKGRRKVLCAEQCSKNMRCETTPFWIFVLHFSRTQFGLRHDREAGGAPSPARCPARSRVRGRRARRPSFAESRERDCVPRKLFDILASHSHPIPISEMR